MAGNQFGSEDTSFAQFYNPALFSEINQKRVGFMHNAYFEGANQELFTYVHPVEWYGNFSGAFNYFSCGKIEGYDTLGLPTNDISADDIMLSGSWSKKFEVFMNTRYRILEKLSTGATIKVLRKKLHTSSAIGMGMDFGFSFPMEWKYLEGLKIAGAVQNVGTKLKFEGEGMSLPRVARLGGAYSFYGNAVTFAADGVMPSDGKIYAQIGAEYRFLQMVSLRLGYKGDSTLDKNFTFGFGFENPRFCIDYAFVPMGDLGDTHRFSAEFRFGKKLKEPKLNDQLREKVKYAKTLYAQGKLVDAYEETFRLQQIAPWLSENNKLIEVIKKDFSEVEDKHKKEALRLRVEAILSKGEKFFEEGNLINAHLEFQAVLGLQPDHRAAQGYLKQIEAQFQSFVQSFYNEGMAAFASENYEKAKELFEKVIVINPDHAEARAQLERCEQVLEKKEQEALAEAQKETIQKTKKEAFKTYMNGNYEEAISYFEEILRIDAKEEESRRYLKLSKENLFKAYMTRGQKFADRGEWESAIKNLRKAVDYNPESKEGKTLLADVQRRWELQKKVLSQNLYKEGLEMFLSGQKVKAKETWEKAIELDPDNKEAKSGLSRINP